MYGRQHSSQGRHGGHAQQHGYPRSQSKYPGGGGRFSPYPSHGQGGQGPPHQGGFNQYPQHHAQGYPPQQPHGGPPPHYTAPPQQRQQPQPPPAAYQLPHPMIAHDPQAFEQMFKDHLMSLVMNSKPIINHLTILAHDHAPKMNTVISNAIEQHIFNAPIPMRLPALYLVDSISKNIGQPYTTNWSGIITRLFLETFRVVDAPTRQRLEELLATWRKGGPNGSPLFGESAQWTIERSLYGTQQNPHGLAHQLAAKDAEMAQQAMRSPLAMHGQHSHAGSAAVGASSSGYSHYPPGQPSAAAGQSGPGWSNGAGGSNGYGGPSSLRSPAQQQGYSGYASPRPHSGQGIADAGGAGAPQFAANTLLASLLQAGLLPDSRGTPPPGTTSVHPASGGGGGGYDQGDAEQDESYIRLIMDLDLSLSSAGPSSSSSSSSAGFSGDWARSVSTQMAMRGVNNFDPLELVLHMRDMPAACKQCANRYAGSKKGHRALDEHLDWHFRQNRRAKDSAARGQSRSWFVNLDTWVRSGFDDEVPWSTAGEGSAGAGTQAGRTAEEEAALRATHQATIVVAPTDAEVAAKPCPICKEKFQSEWSEDEEDWIWRNAVLVNGIYYHASCHASAKVMSAQVKRDTTP